MSVVYRCDSCQTIIEPEADRIDLNVVESLKPIEQVEDIDEPQSYVATIHIAADMANAEHQFCTPSCLAAWAMDRALTPQP